MVNPAFRFSVYFIAISIAFLSCKKENQLPPSIIQFAKSSAEIVEFGEGENIDIDFSSPLQANIVLMIDVNDSTSVYGLDYTTVPEANDGKKIILQVAKGSTSASFKFIPLQRDDAEPNRVVYFTLNGSNDHVVYGESKTIRIVIIDDGSIVQFVQKTLSVKESSLTKTINLTFSSPLQADGNLLISTIDSASNYGVDYLTSPDAIGNTITIPVLKGASTASFTVTPIVQSSSDGDRSVKFSITGLPTAVHLGSVTKATFTILDDDLVCYLPMNGDANDVSDFKNSTTVEGATLTGGRKGLSNTAYELDGISNDIVIPTTSALEDIQKITLTAWLKPVSFTGVGNNAILEKAYYNHSNPYYQYKLGVTGDQYVNIPGSFVFSLSIDGAYRFITTDAGAWTSDNWYFVAGTYDGSNMRLYLNGSLVATLPITGTVDHFGTDIFLGKMENKDAYTPGTLGDIRIYNRALSADEISSLFIR